MIQFRPKPGATVRYKDVEAKLDTGDILLFAGRGGISRLIKFGTYGFRPWIPRWSHTGFVYRGTIAELLDMMRKLDIPCRDTADRDKEPRVFVVESTTLSNVDDSILGRGIKGVQIVPLQLRLAHYEGFVAYRKFYVVRTEGVRYCAKRFVATMHGRPYEKQPLELVLAATKFLKRLWKGSRDSIFCSELVILHMQQQDWLHTERDASDTTPKMVGRFLPLVPSVDAGQPVIMTT